MKIVQRIGEPISWNLHPLLMGVWLSNRSDLHFLVPGWAMIFWTLILVLVMFSCDRETVSYPESSSLFHHAFCPGLSCHHVICHVFSLHFVYTPVASHRVAHLFSRDPCPLVLLPASTPAGPFWRSATPWTCFLHFSRCFESAPWEIWCNL